ncbi:MAG: hypothetical protein CVU61_00125 [Deltaproteobacteria bacterium HGW-Deltaproteobacteria-19]|jgi:hypothetical protein|nr:MAG: hypothetical protein CVU61_00125 [Deltaproteobacteria bacterium HGW-Deltaproteobacteria-19]
MTIKQTSLIVFGPYEIPHEKLAKGTSKQITKENSKSFWDQQEVEQVAMKQGCYIFGLKVGKGFTPWYVGKASKKFKQEALHQTKLTHYNEVIFKGRKGKPVMFFVAKPSNLKKIPSKQINDLEKFLIQSAYYKNPELKNKQNANQPDWGIVGVIRGGKGKATMNAYQFKRMLNL